MGVLSPLTLLRSIQHRLLLSWGCSFACSQRFAYYSAMKAAFSKFIIIRLGNGKITVEVDTSQCDPFLYDSALDHPVVKVSEIPNDPEAEEYSELLEVISEEELNCLLDASVTEEL